MICDITGAQGFGESGISVWKGAPWDGSGAQRTWSLSWILLASWYGTFLYFKIPCKIGIWDPCYWSLFSTTDRFAWLFYFRFLQGSAWRAIGVPDIAPSFPPLILTGIWQVSPQQVTLILHGAKHLLGVFRCPGHPLRFLAFQGMPGFLTWRHEYAVR